MQTCVLFSLAFSNRCLYNTNMTTALINENYTTQEKLQILADAAANEGAASVWPEYAMPTSVQDVEYQGAQMVALGQMDPEDYGKSIDDAWSLVQ